MHISLRTALVGALAAGCTLADVTFDQTIKFTGGSMVEMMRRMANNPILARKGGGFGVAFQDQNYTTYIKGSRMARIGPATSSIIDLNAGTITTINNERHTYSTQTFEEMRQRMEQAQQRMNRGQPVGDMQFDVKVDKTGQTRTIDGKEATEIILTLTAKSGGTNGQMVVKVDSWVAPADDSTHEATEFYKKLGQQFAYAFAGSAGLGSAGSGIAAAYREMAKLDGYALLSDISISGVATPMGTMGGDPNAPIITTETQSSHFVSGPIDDSKFAVPAGYTEDHGHVGGRPQ